jgi:hypothetical protein
VARRRRGRDPLGCNLYLKLLAEEGAVGLLCFLGLIIDLVVLARVVEADATTYGRSASAPPHRVP